tara:strand:+ start:141095 stop:142192 length:1098 start_codon:yes stop_codon:yes gene_type:complete
MGLGLVQVYSSSFVHATENLGDGLYLFKRQFLFSMLGASVMLGVALTDWKNVKVLGLLLWFVAIVGLLLTLYSHFSIKAGGASRWVSLPFGLRFEPSELLKICYPFILATVVAKSFSKMRTWQKVTISLVLLMPLLLLMKQPDFGSIVIIVAMALGVLFVFGLPLRWLSLFTVTSGLAMVALIFTSEYRMNRIRVFLDPWADPSNSGFQVIQSMLTFHSGKLWGRGLGQGQGKLFFLPEAHTDFTLATFAEEMGFIGFAVLVLIYFLLVYRGMRIAALCKKPFEKAVALGITLVLFFNIAINIGVVLGVLPTKGLTLPFMSYGGSSLVTMCMAVGILLCIDRSQKSEYGSGSKDHKAMRTSFYRL